jgi:hypothetical protein
VTTPFGNRDFAFILAALAVVVLVLALAYVVAGR